MNYLKELLQTNSFYMASRKKMNDMYDCFFSISKNYIKKYINNKSIEYKSQSEKSNIEQIHIKIYSQFNPGITCFSESSKNDILWSYYTDSAKGICMEFDFSNEDEKFKETVKKVEYTNNFIINSENDFNKIPYKKKEIFSTEQEWRIVYQKSDQRCTFDISSLKAIYFGIRCKKEHILQIMDIIDDKKYQIKFFKMNFTYKSNLIDFKEISRTDVSNLTDVV